MNLLDEHYNTPNTSNTDNEFKQKLLEQLQQVNINLVYLQNTQKKQEKMIDDIKFNINLIAFCIFIPLLIKVIIIIGAIIGGQSVLEWFSEFLQTF